MAESDIPFGAEFSPNQVDLKDLLEMARLYGGDWKAFEAVVRARYFETHDTTEYNKNKLANNTKLGMQAYEIIDDDANLTALGEDLYEVREAEQKLYETLARYILLHLHGMTYVQCILDMLAGGEDVDLVKLREWLAERGIHVPRGGRHLSSFRLWLEKAGVFTHLYRVDEARLNAIAGVSMEEFEVLSQFTRDQAFYLRTLANIGEMGPFAGRDVEKLAIATYGMKSHEKSLPKDVLQALEQAGYITMEKATSGRGAKSVLVTPTDKLRADLVQPLLKQLEAQTHADLRPYLQQSLAEVVEKLDAADTHVKGLALEALALKLMRLLGLTYVATRLRAAKTAGAEVDVIFETARLVFSRWQVQCKNTRTVSLDDVAKEVGLTHLLKSTVVVMVSTGTIGAQARRYGNKIMHETNLCVVMVDGKDVKRINDDPTAIVDVFQREAEHAMKLKALVLEDTE
jgi:site-specific DNA-methyltransferase (cytosine-N4-specific)